MRHFEPDGRHPVKDRHNVRPVGSIVLRDRIGRSVSLHRYVGRWLVLRVSDLPDGEHLSRCCDGLDGVVMDVVVDEESLPESEHCSHRGCTCMLDDDGIFSRWFPALQWPATFVIDPSGELVAILNDETCEPFMQSLVRRSRSAPSFGAIDRGEIDT